MYIAVPDRQLRSRIIKGDELACRQVPVIENTQIAQVNSPPPPPPSLLPPQAEALRCALPASRPLSDCEAAQRVLQGCTFQQLASDLAYLQPLQQDALKVGVGDGDETSVRKGFAAWCLRSAGCPPMTRLVGNPGCEHTYRGKGKIRP